jgi:CubicO group peptidase (beta-lactamase class C family)
MRVSPLGYGSGGQRATEYTAGYPLVGGAGGPRCTLRDMMRYLEFELGELDSPLNSLLPVLHKARYATGPSIGGGLAWNMQMLGDGTSIISKGGQEPGYSSSIVFTPATHTGAVVLANQKELRRAQDRNRPHPSDQRAHDRPIAPPLTAGRFPSNHPKKVVKTLVLAK